MYLKSVSGRSNYRCVPQIGFWKIRIIVVYLKWVSAKSVFEDFTSEFQTVLFYCMNFKPYYFTVWISNRIILLYEFQTVLFYCMNFKPYYFTVSFKPYYFTVWISNRIICKLKISGPWSYLEISGFALLGVWRTQDPQGRPYYRRRRREGGGICAHDAAEEKKKDKAGEEK